MLARVLGTSYPAFVKKLLLFLAGLVQVFAAAPDSVAGKVFRLSFGVMGRPEISDSTIVLGSDGRYVYLKYTKGIATPGNTLALIPPQSDGSYAYKRTGDSTATLELLGSDNSGRPFELVFNSASSGRLAGIYDPSTFYLTDLAAAQTSPVTNTSVRGQVAPGRPLIAGFVVPGTQEHELLIRVVGPSLTQLDVTGVWADPDFQLYPDPSLTNIAVTHYDDWSSSPSGGVSPMAAFQKIFNYVGAFPLFPGSKDAAMITQLKPGAYTIVAAATAPGDAGGEALIEVYFLP